MPDLFLLCPFSFLLHGCGHDGWSCHRASLDCDKHPKDWGDLSSRTPDHWTHVSSSYLQNLVKRRLKHPVGQHYFCGELCYSLLNAVSKWYIYNKRNYTTVVDIVTCNQTLYKEELDTWSMLMLSSLLGIIQFQSLITQGCFLPRVATFNKWSIYIQYKGLSI